VGGHGDLERERRLEVGLVETGVGGAGVGLGELGVDVHAAVGGVRAVHAGAGAGVGAVGGDPQLVAGGQAGEGDAAVGPGVGRVERNAVERDLADAGGDQVGVGGRARLPAVEADAGDRAEGRRSPGKVPVNLG